MRLTTKRMLVFFSVALNVGFVIVALTLVYQHSISHRERSWREVVDIVGRLDLPADQSQAVLASIRQFRATVDLADQDLRRARGSVINLLAQDGPVDPAALHRLMAVADGQGRRKSDLFEAHVLKLRQLLGDAKGAQFFSLLQQHFKSKDKTPHP
ncbi:hypothetical protein DESC_700188 [Desulfosarcina cetonica]|nr:hypothetical protein DESC_700188 [Desulfosarcina cetonica]